tara:strand:+ start:436 stop:642 length:207 start_codon:yes stop_codon:yes gene_type:complete
MFTKILTIIVYLFSGEGSIIRRIQNSQMKRAAYWQLHNLSDKDLKDIGLTRYDIYEIAYGGRGRGGTT